MAKFRKKPVVVEAVRWFTNGDHPEDDCRMVNPNPHSETQFAPFLSEGKAVRYFRHPDVDGNACCPKCKDRFHDHGWIDTIKGGHNVCPGDWIITGPQGEYYPCKPDIFEQTYEPVEE